MGGMILTSLANVLSLCALIVLGVILKKKNILSEKVSADISALVLNVTLPALLLVSFQKEFQPEDVENIFWMLGLCFLMHVVAWLLGYVVAKLLPGTKDEKHLFIFCNIFANVAFMGFPILASIYGPNVIFLASFSNVFFNILMFTVGLILLDPKSKISAKKLLTAPMIATVIGLLLFIFQLRMPETMSKTLKMLGDMTTPLAMLVIGFALSNTKIKSIVGDFRLYVFSVVKLVITPLAMYFLMRIFVPNSEIMGIVTVLSGIPSASSATILALQYGSNHEFASKLVFISTVLSLITLPLLSAFVQSPMFA